MNAQETNVLTAPKKDLWKNVKRHFSVYALLIIPVVYYAILVLRTSAHLSIHSTLANF